MSEKGVIRVVVFTGGAELRPDVLDFAARLERHSEIDLAGIFCQARGRGFIRVVEDLWKRRGLLAVPLILQRWLRIGAEAILTPSRAASRRWVARAIAGRLTFSPDLHSPDLVARIEKLGSDLGLVYGGPILRPCLYELPKMGTLGIHHGLTPRYRGKKTTFWAIYNGERSVGVTIQVISSQIDQGDIVREEKMDVGRAPLPFVMARLQRLGIDVFMEAIFQYKEGSTSPTPQEPGNDAMYRDPKMADVLRFWWLYFLRLLTWERSG